MAGGQTRVSAALGALRDPGRAAAIRWLVPLCVGVYTLMLRVRGISDRFLMYGDQMRDWQIALGPLGELPLVGTPSTAGGHSLGPVFYWALWAIRVTIGPWVDNLPHAGGIGLSVLQSAADALLVYAIWRRLGSWSIALAAVVFAATSPYDLAMSATIWNPVLAMALGKTALALLLLFGRDRAPWRMAAVAGVAWLAVHAHSGAVFLAGACFAWYVGRELWRRQWKDAAANAFGLQLVVLTLQVPFLLHWLQRPGENVVPTAALSVAGRAGEEGALDLARSFHGIGDALTSMLLSPWPVPWFPWLLLALAGVAVVRWRREPDVVCGAGLPIGLAIAGFATWTLPFDSYWFVTLMPSAALVTVLGASALVPATARWSVALVLLAAVLTAQPARIARSDELFRMPEYGALVQGSRQIVKYGQPVQRVEADFLDPQVDRQVVFTLLGGRLSEDATLVARIARDGSVTFRQDRSRRDR